jgi:hypothetical protein
MPAHLIVLILVMFLNKQDLLCHFLRMFFSYFPILKSEYSPQLIVPNTLIVDTEGTCEYTGESEPGSSIGQVHRKQ